MLRRENDGHQSTFGDLCYVWMSDCAGCPRKDRC